MYISSMSYLLLISIKISVQTCLVQIHYHTSTVAKIDFCLRKVHEEMGSPKLCIYWK